jgi:hypothetical protein
MAFGFIGEENWSTKIKSQTMDASLFSTLIYVILSNLSSVGQMPYNWEPPFVSMSKGPTILIQISKYWELSG